MVKLKIGNTIYRGTARADQLTRSWPEPIKGGRQLADSLEGEMSDASPLYITTPIYYVNDRPHIGHAYCTVLADTLARYRRMFGGATYFLTGTDEHGQKVQQAAETRDVSPIAHCDEMHAAFRDLWPALNIQTDDFIRTTEARHSAVVQAGLQNLWERGLVYARDYEGWYSTTAERFWTEKDLVDGCCPDTGHPVQRITERNYFFRMSEYADALRAHIHANPTFIRPAHRANEVLGFLDKGLEDLCISRPKSRLNWGIELPFDDDYVTYVWFDALLNYVSALGGAHNESTLFERWWPHATHLIGKDILTTHCVYWTTMLLALDVPLPREIIATGWWLLDDAKMSKSSGNVVDPLAMKDVYGPEVLRYFLMRDMVIGLDASFSEAGLVRRNNSDLANDLGNLASRGLKMVSRYFDGVLPEPGEETDAELAVQACFGSLKARLPGFIADLQVHTAIEETMQAVRMVNKYVSETAPFKTIKTDREAAGRALYTVAEALRHTAVLLSPVMPAKMAALLDALGCGEEEISLADLQWGGLCAGTRVGLESALFPRAEPVEEAVPTKLEKKDVVCVSEETDVLAFSDFLKVELRVANITLAEKVTGADRLMRLEVELEGETRQVVSGIAEHFSPEDLVGKQVVMVANLPPRKIFKLRSEGMLLTAETESGGLELLHPGGAVPPGTRLA